MRDLRVYIGTEGSDGRAEGDAFFSRRADGPYYRWLYAAEPAGWHFSRVSVSRLTLRALRVADWDAVPAALRERLDEHYLE